MSEYGKVYILGVGPGDYKLITLKAAECIKKADVIVYDRLVSTKILSFAKEDAELIYAGKLPDLHTVPQEGINEILVKKALEGKVVARVKGGDPFVFGRGGEEAEALSEHGISFEIIPGVTSAIAVPAYAGIPVTHRDYCSSLHIITGHEKPGKAESFIDFELLAKLEGTLVFLMGIKNIAEICSNLIRFGKKGTTPAAVIENGTTVSQRVVSGTLKDIAQKVGEAGIKSPAVTVIGGVAELRDKLQWFSKGSLFGKKVIVTRTREQAGKLVDAIEQLGGEAIEFPTIKVQPPQEYLQFDKILRNLYAFRWIVFTSVHGVKVFFMRMKEIKVDIRRLWGIRLCAVGEATAKELEALGLEVFYRPEAFTSSELLKGLLDYVRPGEKVLLARADMASEELSEGLTKNNIAFEELTVYSTSLETSDRQGILERLEENEIDFITFTSASTVKNFVSILGAENLDKLSGAKLVCIGPVTMEAAEKLGLNVSAMADIYTIEGIVDKLVQITRGG
jgi:uroporphyrinogen III methyltransferase / synthase